MMTSRQAYQVMFLFLVNLWKLKKDEFDDDFPVMLGAMVMLKDGRTMDSAYWYVWEECVSGKGSVTEKEGFDAMMLFLDMYRRRGESKTKEITRVIDMIGSSPDTSWEDWMKCVAEVERIIHSDRWKGKAP